MVSYKLYYFPIRGPAEVARQLFALSKTPYEDIRITMEEWPKHKADMPFEKMPVLAIDGYMLPESFAINRYLARKFGYAGKTSLEEATVDALADQMKDYNTEARPYFTALYLKKPEEEIEKIKTETYMPAANKMFGFLEKYLKKSKSGFFVDSGLTWIDLFVADHFTTLLGWDSHILDDHKEVIFHQNVKEIKF
ncbi:hypothetical protein WR25_27246 isoform B [Diploscapter pachys]|uniref:glutathione transferase n=2 Tax=Diploscapter pachys TaxID=2018661 RepID=A0A2A2LD90_9BILA|nr:hypothetical protein WR25_27246 isoform B [Diploscapter pachys]